MTNPSSSQKERDDSAEDKKHDSTIVNKKDDTTVKYEPNDAVLNDTNDSDMDLIEVELAAGAKAFAFKNYAIATECFSKACEKLNNYHSQNHNAIIDAHISYGKALLRNAISLGGLLGGLNNSNLPAEPEDSTPQALSVPNCSSKDQTGGTSTSKSADNLNGKNPQIHFSGDSDEEEDDDEGEDEVEATEEPVTVEEELENAFQVLEFARQTIQSQIDSLKTSDPSSSDKNDIVLDKLQNKLVDVYDLIAQVHQEGEQFELAVESYKSSLEIKKSRSNFAPGAIAETHLMIALALELIPDNGEQIKQAIGHIDEAIGLMKGHLNNLEKKYEHETADKNPDSSTRLFGQESVQKTLNEERKLAPGDGKIEKSTSDNLKSEIEEIKLLVNELEAKREELKTVPEPPPMTEGDKALQAYLAAVNQNISTSSPHAKSVVHDLDNLVKKRSRPIENSTDNVHEDSSHSDSKLAPTPKTPSKKQKV